MTLRLGLCLSYSTPAISVASSILIKKCLQTFEASFPCLVSHNRFVELEKEILFPLTIVIKKVLPETGTGISLVVSTPLHICCNPRILIRKRALIATVNDELKNIAQIEYSRHRAFNNFVTNALSAIAAYCFFEKKLTIDVNFIKDEWLDIF